MQVKQQFVVSQPRAVVWDYFGQIDKVTLCMPGASLVEPATDDRVKFRFNVKLGPISASFLGDAELMRDPANYRGTIRGSGRDSRGNSRASGALEYVLSEEGPDATRVDVTADFTLTGALAQFGRTGLVQDLASRLTADFARNIEAALSSDGDRGQTESAGESRAVPRAAREIGAGRLILSALWERIKAIASRLTGRKTPH